MASPLAGRRVACPACIRSFDACHYLGTVRFAVAASHAKHFSRDSVLGHCRPHDRLRASTTDYFAGRVAEQNVWPVTYLMLQSVEGSALLFFYIVADLYSAELLWRERDTHFDGIHDALPMRETTDWLSRLTAIVVVELVLLTFAMLIGIVMQTILRLLPLRVSAIFQGTLSRNIPADPHLHPSLTLRADHRVEQIHGLRHPDRGLRARAHPVQLRMGEHSLPHPARPPPTLTPT